jgi:hypothetical protein
MRFFPKIFEMRNPAHHENDIQIALSDDLISNVYIAVLRVAGFRFGGR